MKRHQKRQTVPKSWPIHRKGTTFVIRANSNGIPVLVLLRDVLKIAQNRKEVKKAIHEKNILINGREVKDEKNCALFFDVLTIVPSKKNYRLELNEKGKYKLEEIKDTEANKKIAKVINKKTLKAKKVQLNLSGGMNFLSDLKCNSGDSVIINLKENKIEKCLPLTEKAQAIVFSGKHTGEEGKIKKIDKKMAVLDINGKDVQVLIKQLMVVE